MVGESVSLPSEEEALLTTVYTAPERQRRRRDLVAQHQAAEDLAALRAEEAAAYGAWEARRG